MSRLAAVLLVAVVAVSGCTTVERTPLPLSSSCACASPQLTQPPGALSEDAAKRAALALAPTAKQAPSVSWAQVDISPFPAPGGGSRSLVWMVRLEGSFDLVTCNDAAIWRDPTPSDPPCLDVASGLIVVLDVYSGAFLGWTH